MILVKDLSNIDLNKKTFLQFGAQWCGPCRAMTSYIEEHVEKDYPNIDFVKIDIEDCDKSLLEDLKVMSVPAVFVYEGGTTTKSFVGFNKEKIINAIKQD